MQVFLGRLRRSLPTRPLLVDSLLATATAVFLVVGAAPGQGSFGQEPELFAYVLAVLSAVPLVVRRSFPIVVLLAVAGFAGLFFLFHYRSTLGQPGALLAAYTVWARRPPSVAWAPTLAAAAIFEGTMVLSGAPNLVGDSVLAIVQSAAVVLIGHMMFLRAGLLLKTADRADRAERATQLEAGQAVAEERIRIAHELHDVVSHHLSVISVQANLARYVFTTSPDTARCALDVITGTTTEALDELRRLLAVLRPPSQGTGEYRPQPGLADLPALAARIRESGVDVELRLTGVPRPLPSGQQLCAYRIAQEALTNVLKHAGRATAELTVDYHEEHLVLRVADSGLGAAASPNPAGHGLVGMRERARMYGGVIEIGPRGGGGFEIELTLPYPQPGRPFTEPQEPS